MSKLSEILRGAKNLRRVELLRYNKIAGAKYYMLGKTYFPGFDANKTPEIWDEFTKMAYLS